MSLFQTVADLRGKDKDLFIDENGNSWALRADDTGMMLVCYENGETKTPLAKFTSIHMMLCEAPKGFRRKPDAKTKVHEIAERISILAAEMASLQMEAASLVLDLTNYQEAQ